jgi:hypothetical protein
LQALERARVIDNEFIERLHPRYVSETFRDNKVPGKIEVRHREALDEVFLRDSDVAGQGPNAVASPAATNVLEIVLLAVRIFARGAALASQISGSKLDKPPSAPIRI